jgi:hypothetical protein
MMSEHERFVRFQQMVRSSTDPQFVRQQFGQPHQYSKTFTVCMLVLGTLAAYGILFAVASL